MEYLLKGMVDFCRHHYTKTMKQSKKKMKNILYRFYVFDDGVDMAPWFSSSPPHPPPHTYLNSVFLNRCFVFTTDRKG